MPVKTQCVTLSSNKGLNIPYLLPFVVDTFSKGRARQLIWLYPLFREHAPRYAAFGFTTTSGLVSYLSEGIIWTPRGVSRHSHQKSENAPAAPRNF